MTKEKEQKMVWIKINNESDVPNSSDILWMIYNEIIMLGRFDTQDKLFLDEFGTWYSYKDISHYYKIEKPEPPEY